MKIVLPGGSGHVGSLLSNAFHAKGHEVVVLSRNPSPAAWRTVPWDARNVGEWASELDGADVVINLAGRSVNCRYGPENRKEILDSRVLSTRAVGQAIAQSGRPPALWLQASTATIYAHRYDAPNDDVTGVIGGSEPSAPDTWRFSIQVALAWERALDEANIPHTRTVKLRSAIILAPDRGSIFDTLLRVVRFGLSGSVGDGRQFVSWVHYEDFIRAIDWLIGRKDIHGFVNIASPNPLPYREFMAAFRKAWGIPFGLPATPWMMEMVAWLIRTETELILKSRRVVPRRLLDEGFVFQHPDWPQAASDLCNLWRETRNSSGMALIQRLREQAEHD